MKDSYCYFFFFKCLDHCLNSEHGFSRKFTRFCWCLEHYHHCHSSIFCGIRGPLPGGGGPDLQKVRARRDWDLATCHPQKLSFPEAEGLLPPFSASVSPAADLSPSLFFSGLTLGHNITEAQWLAQDYEDPMTGPGARTKRRVRTSDSLHESSFHYRIKFSPFLLHAHRYWRPQG